MSEVVSLEVAKKEIQSWLDYKKVGSRKRETYKSNINVLSEAVSDGVLVLNDDFSFQHTLKFPIGETGAIKDLRYRPRLCFDDVSPRLSEIDAGSFDQRLAAYGAALIELPMAIIGKMDSEDLSIVNSIAVFFL